MKAISVRQPWAWAIIHAGKCVENRTRNIAGNYRGPVAIHASKTCDELDFCDVYDLIAPEDPPEMDAITFGAVIGVVNLAGVHYLSTWSESWSVEQQRDVTCSPWAIRGPIWHLELTDPRPLPEPIPYRGQLGLWDLPDDVLPPEFRPSHHTRSNS
ncbi:MAG: hypothetical protein KIT69_19290 [Propionibacteriaceae bacterium]|nr:hypothetical protein [Propionibacteriaceae bacterium]